MNNIKTGLVEIKWGSVHWIGLVQDSVKGRAPVKAGMNIRILKNVMKLSSG
jgi:transcription antitermination factor NusA-like protein